jgi:hypothetical protein
MKFITENLTGSGSGTSCIHAGPGPACHCKEPPTVDKDLLLPCLLGLSQPSVSPAVAVVQINTAKLPPGINQKLAEDIEFVGRAVRLLRAPPADALLKKRPIPSSIPAAAAGVGGYHRGRLDSSIGGVGHGAIRSSNSTWGQPAAAAARAAAAVIHAGKLHGGESSSSSSSMPAWEQQAVLHRQGLVVHPLLPYEDTLEFAKALAMLQEQQLPNPVALERTVEAIRADVSTCDVLHAPFCKLGSFQYFCIQCCSCITVM